MKRLKGFETVVHVNSYGFEMTVRKHLGGDTLKTEDRWRPKGRDLLTLLH